jgi:hypothetical protein
MKSKVWAYALPYALTSAAFSLQVIVWDHVTNQFSFIHSDANLFATLTCLGAAWNAAWYSVSERK